MGCHALAARAGAIRSVAAPAIRRVAGLFALALAVCACDIPGDAGPRVLPTSETVLPYPVVADPPASEAKADPSQAQQYVLLSEVDESIELGHRQARPTRVTLDELLRALWRLRGDPLGSYSAASSTSAPFVLASRTVPADRIARVVSALWRHGARLLVAGGGDGAPREHPVRLMAAEVTESRVAVAAGRATLAFEGGGLMLNLPGQEPRSIPIAGAVPTAADLVRALDAAATVGARTLLLRGPSSEVRSSASPPSPTHE